MKIFVNKKIKMLFCKILLCITIFIIFAVLCVRLENTAIYIFIAAVCMSAIILILCYKYFYKQNKIIEDAAAKIREYSLGNTKARIECNDEGELNKLFHEMNSLAAIMNTHAEKEICLKKFLKKTISDISHQLKTPLAALNIYNGIMQDNITDSDTVKEFTDLSEKELDRIETLVQNILKLTKLDSGTIAINKENENVYEILEDIKNRFVFRANQEEKQIIVTGDTDAEIICDRVWFIEAIENIVKNALDHTSSGDKILLSCKSSASIIQITITDNGSGIHQEDLYHIFKRFYRSRFSKDTQGTGLGLSLAKSIIEEHNGTIEVDSELEKGTIVIINFFITTKL